MTLLARVKVEVAGWVGGPGVNVLHFSAGLTQPGWDDAQVNGLLDDVYATYLAMTQIFSPGITVTVNPEVSLFNDTSGEIQNVVVGTTTPSTFVTTGGNAQTVPSTMLLARFGTDRFMGGRRLQGRSFIGPCTSTAFDSSGTIVTPVRNTLEAAYDGLVSGLGARLAVWHRPSAAGMTDGAYGDVVNVQAWGKPAVLRSRRD